MANVGNQKLKILKIMEMFLRESDEQHPLSAKDIEKRLEDEGLTAERKSIYRDIGVLQEYGMDIEKNQEGAGYYLASREFQLPELKLLVDAVAASKFISEKKSKELVQKIETLASIYEGRQLQRQVVVSDRVKSANERIYYVIDEIYNCIDNQHQMEFRYWEWDENKRQVPRHGGRVYRVSPGFLLWDNEFYYLVAYDENAGEIRHYRVDKIQDTFETDQKRTWKKSADGIRRENYTRKRFSMFAGDAKSVNLRAPKSYAGVFIDRFGRNVSMRCEGEEICIRVEVEISPQFYGWLTGLGPQVVVTGPHEVADGYRKYLDGILHQYIENQTNV